MSLLAAALRELIAAGVSGEALAQAVERIEAARTGEAPPPTARQLRNRRQYVRRKAEAERAAESGLKAAEASETAERSETLPPIPPFPFPGPLSLTPLTPQPDIITVTPSPTAGSETGRVAGEKPETDWPGGWRGAAGPLAVALAGMNRRIDIARQPGLTTTLAEIIRWRQMGASWDLDVVPVITGWGRRGATPVKGWGLFTENILEARRRRLRPPDPEPPEEAFPDDPIQQPADPSPNRKARRARAAGTERGQRLQRMLAGAMAVADRADDVQ